MSHISKHNSKQERESDLSENGWINFFVHWDTISIHNFLERHGELIDLNIGRWFDSVASELFEICSWVGLENFFDSVFFFIWTPEISYVHISP